MESKLVELNKKRHSIYALGENLPLTQDEVYELVTDTIQSSPTAFNSQTVRAVVLFGEKSNRVWDIVEETLRKIVPAENFQSTADKIASFRAGAGTILYFTDMPTVEKLENDFKLYADNFKPWAEQAIGGAQQAVWVALAEQGIGASLQHYNPLIDDAIRAEFDLPAGWQLRAQMPFDSIEAPAEDKPKLAKDEQFRLFN